MDITQILDYLDLLIIAAGLLIGYLIKHTPKLDSLTSYIPLIVSLVGAVIGVATKGVSVEVIIMGATSGLASTGLHQVYTQLLKLGDDK
jgi:hypothetical protein